MYVHVESQPLEQQQLVTLATPEGGRGGEEGRRGGEEGRGGRGGRGGGEEGRGGEGG